MSYLKHWRYDQGDTINLIVEIEIKYRQIINTIIIIIIVLCK